MEAGGPSKVICRLLCHLRVGMITVHGGEKALVFQEVTSGQVRPDHTMAPAALEPEDGPQGAHPGPSTCQRCQTSPTAPQSSGCILGASAGCTEVERCC